MPFAPAIRRDILRALEGAILPALRASQIPLWRVASLFAPPPGIDLRLLQEHFPQPREDGLLYPVIRAWPQIKMHATSQHYIGILYEGEADERTLLSSEQANFTGQHAGIYAIRWRAPAVLYFPPETPRNAGSVSFWHDAAPLTSMKILWIDALDTETLVHTHTEKGKTHYHTSHSLRIRNATLSQLLSVFIHELTRCNGDNTLSQAVLFPAMLCLQRELVRRKPTIANTSRPPISKSELAVQTFDNVVTYIHTHLDEDLSLSELAEIAELSQVHLNRLFRAAYDMSVMHYVRTQRIEAAKNILINGSENVAEISLLVGFKSSSSFGKVFRRLTGVTPMQFREQYNKQGI